jgi:hypothetical protein
VTATDSDGPNPLSVTVTYVVEGYPNTEHTVVAQPSGNNSFTATIGPLLDTATTSYTSPMDFTATASDGRTSTSAPFNSLITFQNCMYG